MLIYLEIHALIGIIPLMRDKDLKVQIYEWAKKVGSRRARAELVTAGLGLSTVGKLLAGKYEPEPKGIAEILEAVLKNKAAS